VAAGTALIVCKDARTRQLIIESLQPFAIRPEICEEAFSAATLLDRQKFEAIIVDLLLGQEALLLMEQLRFSRTNRTAVTFAITTGDRPAFGARPDSTFMLERPLSAAAVNQTLRAAYGLVVRERRRYFRCPIAVPAFVRAKPPEEFLCQTVNISEGGVAISTRTMPESTLPAVCVLPYPTAPASCPPRRRCAGCLDSSFNPWMRHNGRNYRNGWLASSMKLCRRTLRPCSGAPADRFHSAQQTRRGLKCSPVMSATANSMSHQR